MARRVRPSAGPAGWRRALFSPDESGRAMALYAARHPRAALQLLRLCGLEAEATEQEFYQVGHDFIPFVALTPTQSSLV